jgi:ParB family chromosome partitioning protein
MAARRSALGRGLDALIPNAQAAEAKPDGDALGRGAIEVDRIDANPEQPRRRFPEPELAQLAASIRRHGVLQPVVVRRAGERFELVVGERRWRAARLAGCSTIPAVVADVAERDRLDLALVENVQRDDLNPIELALAFRSLSASGATQEEIGARVGLDRSSVANHLRLLELSRELQADVEEGRLSAGHAKALLQIPNPEGRRALRSRIVDEQLSVRQAEESARGLTAAASRRRRRPAPVETDPDLAQLVDALRDRLQTRVRLVGTATRGRLEVEYFGGEELHRIAAAILD